MFTSLFSLFYITGECYRFLQGGRAQKVLPVENQPITVEHHALKVRPNQ